VVADGRLVTADEEALVAEQNRLAADLVR
jgi:hypothetical protein